MSCPRNLAAISFVQDTIISFAYCILYRLCARVTNELNAGNKTFRTSGIAVMRDLYPLWDLLWNLRRQIYTNEVFTKPEPTFFSYTRKLFDAAVNLYALV